MENSIVPEACCFMHTEKKRTNGLAQFALKEKPVRSQRICSPRSGAKDFLLTNPDKFRNTKEKFGHRRCREDMWAGQSSCARDPRAHVVHPLLKGGRYAEFE